MTPRQLIFLANKPCPFLHRLSPGRAADMPPALVAMLLYSAGHIKGCGFVDAAREYNRCCETGPNRRQSR